MFGGADSTAPPSGRARHQDPAPQQYMDTDSFVRGITTDDVYMDMKEDEDIYDTSNYDPNNPLFSNKNKKVVGKFKD